MPKGYTPPLSSNGTIQANVSQPNIWILARLPDAIFFISSGLLGLAFGYFAGGTQFAQTGAFLIYFLLGLTHFGSTWLFYLDNNNRTYFKTKPIVFFVVPLLLITLPVSLALSGLSALAIIITYWFSGWHVMKQSTGITSIYRHRIGIKDVKGRKTDNLVILSASTFALFGRYLIFTDFGYEGIFKTSFLRGLIFILLAVFIFALAQWIKISVKRFKEHGQKAIPLFLFTLVSIVLFSPFLYVENFTVAFMSNLTGHYSQYLALMWMLNRKKYYWSQTSQPQAPILSFVSKNFYIYAAALIGYALVVTYVDKISILLPLVGLTWAHFYLDRYLFRFKDPVVRKMILPYL